MKMKNASCFPCLIFMSRLCCSALSTIRNYQLPLKSSQYPGGKRKEKEKLQPYMQNDGTPSHDGGGEQTKVTAESFWLVRIDMPD